MFLWVGGGTGIVSIALAEAFPALRFTVQDLDEPIKLGRSALPVSLTDRIHFETQDFFQTNQAKQADVFLLRFILHDWPDDKAVRILRSLRPAMTDDTTLLISDVVSKEGRGELFRDKLAHHMDILMMLLFGAQERSEVQWKRLLDDAGFEIADISHRQGSAVSLIEARKL